MKVLVKDDNGQWWLFEGVDTGDMTFRQVGTDKIHHGVGDEDYTSVDPSIAWLQPNSYCGPIPGKLVSDVRVAMKKEANEQD